MEYSLNIKVFPEAALNFTWSHYHPHPVDKRTLPPEWPPLKTIKQEQAALMGKRKKVLQIYDQQRT
jgi:hypothetical protein